MFLGQEMPIPSPSFANEKQSLGNFIRCVFPRLFHPQVSRWIRNSPVSQPEGSSHLVRTRQASYSPKLTMLFSPRLPSTEVQGSTVDCLQGKDLWRDWRGRPSSDGPAVTAKKKHCSHWKQKPSLKKPKYGGFLWPIPLYKRILGLRDKKRVQIKKIWQMSHKSLFFVGKRRHVMIETHATFFFRSRVGDQQPK